MKSHTKPPSPAPPLPAGAMLACELAHLTREDGPGFDPSPAVSPPALRRDSLASLAPESRGLAAEGAPRGGSGGSGPGPQPYRGLCRLLRALVGLSSTS